MGSKVFGGLCHRVNCAGARCDVITPAFSCRTTLASVPRRWIWARLSADTVCQPISALWHIRHSSRTGRMRSTGQKRRTSLRPGHRGRWIIPFACCRSCGIHLGCKLFTAFELDQVVGRQHLRQSSALAIFRVQSNASARQSASTVCAPISKELESVRRQPVPIVAPAEDLPTNRIRSPNRSTRFIV